VSTQAVNEFLLVDTAGDRLLVTNGALDLLIVDTAQVPWPYSPPVWQVKGSVDKVPWNPRIHWKKFR
jgi:hypothetical protein